MMEWLVEWWWVVLLVWLVLTKLNRHAETRTKEKDEKAVWDAESLVATVVGVVSSGVKDPKERDRLLNEMSFKTPAENVYKRALADGVIHLLEQDPEKKFTPVMGTHPLEQLAGRAVKAETRREKVKQGLKTAGVVTLKILRGGLL